MHYFVQLGPVILTPVEFFAKIDNCNVATNVIKTLLSNYLELRYVIAYAMEKIYGRQKYRPELYHTIELCTV